MTMVLPSPYDVVDTHHNHLLDRHSNAVVYGGEIDSIRRRSTSTSPAASIPNHCNYFNSFDQMADELTRPDHDPNQPSSSSVIDLTADENWLNLRLGGDDPPTSSSTLDTRRRTGGGRGVMDIPATTNPSHLQQLLNQQLIRSNTRPPGYFHQPPRPVTLLQRIPVPESHWSLTQRRSSNTIGGNYHMANPAVSSMSLMMPMGPDFFARPNFGGATQMRNNNSGGRGEGMSSSYSGMQIIRPPRRSNVGVWFMLQAWHNQIREPFLPQIPKRYLRIKNGEMTIRLLMKYVVQKLGLESESEVEIRCRGQELEPMLTLQHVRDSIWCTRRDTPLNLHTDSPSSSTLSGVPTESHIMILHYARPMLSTATAAATTLPVPTLPLQMF